ncbi:hypothetical protein [Actinospongicola halichondriae]|uniref:hypothetical protein n=1 Tax=Actinospongicola halichondriae TaxID=3236844 RepID=UPI003D478841
MLEDGNYDALAFDAETEGDEITVELTILSGDHKGAVVSLRTTDWHGDETDLLGIPATITVADGVPSVVFEP